MDVLQLITAAIRLLLVVAKLPKAFRRLRQERKKRP
jgi:hypothetical protein